MKTYLKPRSYQQRRVRNRIHRAHAKIKHLEVCMTHTTRLAEKATEADQLRLSVVSLAMAEQRLRLTDRLTFLN